ncbi:MAG: 5'-nucleotidase C-terminal domain-containing protein [Caldisericia bacterium]|nr:5'-nucleotidase C-terminal domain-containing protein [Caldisericia bacterium]
MLKKIKRILSVTLTFLMACSVVFVNMPKTSALDIFPFVVLCTGNVRGQLTPFEYGPNVNEGGLSKIATVATAIRKETDDREGYHMLLDAGNTLFGSDLATYYTQKPMAGKPHPVVAVMNELAYDAAGYTSLDFSMPPQIRDARKRESDFTWVCTNAYRSGSLYASDHRMLVYDVPNSAHVLKIAVISLPDPSRENSIPSENISGLEFYDPIEEVVRSSDVLKEIERADFIILLTDMKWEKDPEKRKGSFLDQLLFRSRIDICITTSDDPIPGEQVVYPDSDEFPEHDVLISSPGRYGLGLSRVELMLEKCKCPVKPYEVMKKENGNRLITGKVVKIGQAIEEDPEIRNLIDTYRKNASNTFDELVGTASQTFTFSGSTYRPTSLANLMLDTMTAVTGTPLAMNQSSELLHNLNKGPLTYGDIYSIVAAEDTIYKIALTGQTIKDTLEDVGNSLAFGIESAGISTKGFSYKLDLRKPSGQKVMDLKVLGKPIQLTTQYDIAVTASLVSGSGRPDSLANVSIKENSRKTIRKALIDSFYDLPNNTITPTTSGSWYVVPDYLDHWGEEPISFLVDKTVIKGYTDGSFKPNNLITRAEYTTVVLNAYNIPQLKPKTPSFKDVKTTDWYYGIVEGAQAKNMIPFATNQLFMPNKPITRQDAMIELVIAYRDDPSPPTLSDESQNVFKANVKDWQTISKLAFPYMVYAYENGLITGYADGTIRPEKSISRAETATIVFRAHYPVIMIGSTGNVANEIRSLYRDPNEDRPIGGFASVASYFDQLSKRNTNFMAIDAGNFLMGSSLSYLSKGDYVVTQYEPMNYGAIGLSDEDFFYGFEYLNRINQSIDIVAADIYSKETGKPLYKDSIIQELSGIKVGITGVTGFSIEKPYIHPEVLANIEIKDAVEAANAMLKHLVQEGSHITVLTVGMDSRVNLDNELSPVLVNFIDQLNPKPSFIIALNGDYGYTYHHDDIPVIAAGRYGNSMGETKIIIDAITKNIERITLHNQYSYIDDMTPSKKAYEISDDFRKTYQSELHETIGKTNNGLKISMGGESTLGNLISDVMKYSMEEEGAQVACITPGLIKANINPGTITAENIYDVLPKDEDLVLIEMLGEDLLMVLEHGCTFSAGMTQVSGVKFAYDNLRFLYDRIVECNIDDVGELVYEDKYKVVTTESMRRGLDGYEWFANGTVVKYYEKTLRESLFEYIEKEGTVDREIEDRITLVYTG